MILQQPVGPVVFCYGVGFGLLYAHAALAKILWKAQYPDVISMMASTGAPPPESPWWHNVIHHVTWKFRFLGYIFVAMGVYGTGEWVWELLTGRVY